MDIFTYGLMMGAGLATGVIVIDLCFAGLKKLIGRYISVG